jgi:hypothetical protein
MIADRESTLWPTGGAQRLLVSLFTIALVVPLGVLNAQYAREGLRPGDRVRVTTVNPDSSMGTRRATGVVQSLAEDHLTVAWGNGRRSTLTNAEISRLDVSMGAKPYVWRGMGLGLLGGVVVGAAIGAVRYERSDFLDFGIGVEMLGHAVIVGAAGTVVGGVIGAMGRRERWSRLEPRVDPQRIGVEPMLGRHARGVRVVMRF